MAKDSALIAVESGHQLDLVRFGTALGSNATPYLTAISKKTREILYRYEYIETIGVRNKVIAELSEFMEAELGEYIEETEKSLNALVAQEVDFQYTIAKEAVGKGVALSRPTIKQTKALIKQKPLVLDGKSKTVANYLGSYTPNQIAAVEQIITAGWVNGETTRQIAQSITGTAKIKGAMQQSQQTAYMQAHDITSQQ